MSAPQDCIWMDLFPTVVDSDNSSVKAAWDTYRMLITLAEQMPEPDESWLKSMEKDPARDAANHVPLTKEEKAKHEQMLDILARSI